MIDEDSLEAQVVAQMRNLPTRPLVLGGCCCAHLGAIRGLASRRRRLAVVWIDAHDTPDPPDISSTGSVGGTTLRMAIDAGAVAPIDLALVGAWNPGQPIDAHLHRTRTDEDLGGALEGCDGVYVALDGDTYRPDAPDASGSRRGGLMLETLLGDIATRAPLAGFGLTGLRDTADPASLARLAAAVGL